MSHRYLAALSSLLVPSLAAANGLEPPTTASARYAGIGDAAASSVTGPDALLLNPAGLSRVRGFELTLNAMPVVNRTSAPIVAPGSLTRSDAAVAPLAELLLAVELFDGLGAGAGFNFAGGQGASFGVVDFGDFAMDPEVSQAIGAVEASVGAGFAITESLSVGAAWRATYMLGEMRSAAVLPNGMLQSLALSDASGSSFEGFRFGVQYRTADDRFGLGASLRTPVAWRLTGQGAVTVATPQGAAPAMPIGDVTLELVFPLQLALGADVAVADALRLFGQYSYSNYSANEMQSMEMGGQILEQKLAWSDRHTAQAGAEYQVSASWVLRAGYIFESRVVPADRPGIYAPPGVAHNLALGAGTELGNLRLDFAALYGHSTGVGAPAADAPAFAGEYTADNLVFSGSASYRF